MFLFFGGLTALVGGVMCFAQRHVKRLLAFSTISHVGMILIGAGLLTPQALAGSALYVISHGMVKAALFMCAGIFLQRMGTLDEQELRGRGRDARILGVIFVFAALGLAGFPPYGTYVGKALMEKSSAALGQTWVPWVFALTSALTSGAVLRVAGGVFLGWGSTTEVGAERICAPEQKETDYTCRTTPMVMITMASILAALPAVSAFVPHVAQAAQGAAARFVDTSGYASAVLDARPAAVFPTDGVRAVSFGSVVIGTCAAVTASVIALAGLLCDRIPRPAHNLLLKMARPLVTLHSGDVRDYVSWLLFGMALLAFCMRIALG